jgi:hypothetical protein
VSYGDEIMAGGQAREMAARTGKRVHILPRTGSGARWSDMWIGLDWIARPHERGDFATIRNAPGCRPYIKYPWKGGAHKFTNWRAAENLGAIQFTESEYTFGRNGKATLGGREYVVIEPNIDVRGNKNKQWGWDNWQKLVNLMPDVLWLQLGPLGTTRLLHGVQHLPTPTFRLAAAVLANARLAVLPEGGLHHASGVMGMEAVVLFGGTTSVHCTGYPHHTNIDDGKADPCGSWGRCEHCQRAWASIRPEYVAERVRAQLQVGSRKGDGHGEAA